jgi:hypothetical protein
MKDYFMCVSNFQKVHNSLNVLGIKKHYKYDSDWTNLETEINFLKNQGINIVLSDELNFLFY